MQSILPGSSSATTTKRRAFRFGLQDCSAMVARSSSATPRRSTRSQSREVESRHHSLADEDAASSSAIEASTSKATTTRKPRRATNASAHSETGTSDAAGSQVASTSTIVEEIEGEETVSSAGPEEASPVKATPARRTKGLSNARNSIAETNIAEKARASASNGQAITPTLDDRSPKRKARAWLLSLVQRGSALLPYLSAFLIIAATALAVAIPSPQKPFQRNVYVDENALQPGAANVEWSWADVEFSDKLAAHVAAVAGYSSDIRSAFLTSELRSMGFTTYNQSYSFDLPDDAQRRRRSVRGINTYARWPASRGDGKEAFVIAATWKSSWDGSRDPEADPAAKESKESDGAMSAYERSKLRRTNVRGITTALAIARFLIAFRQWSKDLIFVFGDGEMEGMQAWTSAYFGREQKNLWSEPLYERGALIWNAIAIDYPSDSFSHIEFRHEGLNGQLPNLDVISTLDELMHRAQHVPTILPASSDEDAASPLGAVGDYLDKKLWTHGASSRQYMNNLRNAWRQVALASGCHPSGSHGLFHRYHVDAVTLFARPAKGPFGFYNMGRAIESMTRSMSNLLERLHHSHFFYILTSPKHFVEVAKYLPVASLLSAALLIAAIVMWVQEGQASKSRHQYLVSTIREAIQDEGAEDLQNGHVIASNGNADMHSQDVPLLFPTLSQKTQDLVSVLIQRSTRRGDLVGSTKVRLMAAILQTQSRPYLQALGISLFSHVVALAIFASFTTAPVDCARNGLWSCKPLRLSMAIILFGTFAAVLGASRRTGHGFRRSLLAVQSLLPNEALGDLLALRHIERRSVARATLILAMLEAGIVTLIISIVNFGLAVAMASLLAVPLCTIRLPQSHTTQDAQHANTDKSPARMSSPASDDSDTVDALLPVSEASFGICPRLARSTRIRLALHGVVLLCLAPPPVLFAAKMAVSLLARLATMPSNVLTPTLLALRSHTNPALVELLVDGALWDYHIFSSILLPILCGTYIPILITSAAACFLMASAKG